MSLCSRYGLSLGYQILAAIGSGIAPIASFDNSCVPVALYIMFTAVVSLIAIWAVKAALNQL